MLGIAHIATFASVSGLNVAVLDAETNGIGPTEAASIVNEARPRWVGINLLSPTYELAVRILQHVDPAIAVMLGGHHAKASTDRVLKDSRIPRIDALIVGEADTRATAVLKDKQSRSYLPDVYWRAGEGVLLRGGCRANAASWLAPNLDALPMLDRRFLAGDPFVAEDGRTEANIVASRGCPFNCSFCGAARRESPALGVRSRAPAKVAEEMTALWRLDRVTAFRFVDDLFLANSSYIEACARQFCLSEFAGDIVWDATGRANVLARARDETLNLMGEAGCREIALGIESGSPRVLRYIQKQLSLKEVRVAVQRLSSRGIRTKGYFILGFPTETEIEMLETIRCVRELRVLATKSGGRFRASVFQFRPYPGTLEWRRLLQTGRFSEHDLLSYRTNLTPASLDREEEFDFSLDIQVSDVDPGRVRRMVRDLMDEESDRPD